MFRAVIKRVRQGFAGTTSIFNPRSLPSRTLFRRPIEYNYRDDESRKISQLAIAASAASVVAGAYVAHDYCQAITGTKKRGYKEPLTALDFLYVALAKDDDERRKLGLIPEKLFEAGQFAIKSGKNPDKWFRKMLSVTPTASEWPLYNKVAEYY